jgi:hypothetical protein
MLLLPESTASTDFIQRRLSLSNSRTGQNFPDVTSPFPLERLEYSNSVQIIVSSASGTCSNTKTTRVNDSIHWSTRLYSRRLN